MQIRMGWVGRSKHNCLCMCLYEANDMFRSCCTRWCSRCRRRRRSLLPKWRRRESPLLPSESGTRFSAGIRSGFASGSLRTASGSRISTILRSASMSLCIHWRSRSLAFSNCSVACCKFCCCCCCSCCRSNKPSCSYCRSGCLLLWERRCGALWGYCLL